MNDEYLCRNFVAGARVKLKNPRSGRGNGALVILGSLDRDTRQLGGLSVSGLPVAKSKFERNVYIYDCLQHIG